MHVGGGPAECRGAPRAGAHGGVRVSAGGPKSADTGSVREHPTAWSPEAGLYLNTSKSDWKSRRARFSPRIRAPRASVCMPPQTCVCVCVCVCVRASLPFRLVSPSLRSAGRLSHPSLFGATVETKGALLLCRFRSERGRPFRPHTTCPDSRAPERPPPGGPGRRARFCPLPKASPGSGRRAHLPSGAG